MAHFYIGDRKVGDDAPVFIIAEAGINHDGKLDQALALIDVAKEAGADAVKFQMFQADRMYQKEPGLYETAKGEEVSIFSLVEQMELPPEWLPTLLSDCEKKGLIFLSTVCDEESADLLNQTNPSAFKLASYEINHLPLLRHTASFQKPMIFSTAGATIADVHEAYEAITSQQNKQVAIMHCVAKYPAPREYTNLRVLQTFTSAFPEAVIGFSDHSMHPTEVPVAAVKLGAAIIEKHFTVDKTLPGADHSFALDPKELKEMVQHIRIAEKQRGQLKADDGSVPEVLLGSSFKTTTAIEGQIREFAYRGVFTTKGIAKGDTLTRENVAVLRPGQKSQGLHPRYLSVLIGAKATRNIPPHTGVSWDDVLVQESQDDK
ncbi:N-acetylneuraminate synthase family protein [Bacillus sp. 179-C3.3 HS]|uniref:N-acetylneuraminate synthase family protein n=1 Tax=Bacillus sp. 179-C3.3 HS TaxID=3232162 RepID=UPI0039A02339